jgi:hypothetical protein
VFRSPSGVEAAVWLVIRDHGQQESAGQFITHQVEGYRNQLTEQQQRGRIEAYSIFFDEPDSVRATTTLYGRQVGAAVKARGKFYVALFYVFASDTSGITVSGGAPRDSWQRSGIHELATALSQQALR